jgi:hypothetical protein
VPLTLEDPRESSRPTGVDNGVIEEARVRQRRRRVTGAALGVVAACASIGLLLIGGRGGSSSGASGEARAGRPLKLALVRGRAFSGGQPALMGVTWSLQAGNVGVCVRVINRGHCNGQPPTRNYPLYGGPGGYSPEEKVGPQGEINAIFVGRGVAALRVAHLGTFRARSAPGLPPGAKQIVFYRPPGSRGSVLPPGVSPKVLVGFGHAKGGPALSETLLDSRGQPIHVGSSAGFTLPNSYWQGSQSPPAAGRCAMSSSLPGTRTDWGQVATVIAPDPSITTAAWLTCLHVGFSQAGASYETALLLNGRSPGARPAALWGAVALPGHPGIYEIPARQREIRIPPLTAAQARHDLAVDTKTVGRVKAEQIIRESDRRVFVDTFIPAGLARRVGPAWLLVNDGTSLAGRLAFLASLHVSKLNVGG